MKRLHSRLGALLLGAAAWCCGSAQAASGPGFSMFDTQVHFYTSDFAQFPLHDEHAYMSQAVMTQRAAEHPTVPHRVFGDWQQNGVGAGVGIQYGAAYEGDNSYVLSVAQRFPRRVTPVVILDTASPDAPAQLRRLAQQQRVAGFRKLGKRAPDGGYPWLHSPGMLRLWSVADAQHLVVELMPYPRSPDPRFLHDIAELAARFPHAKIVLDHCAWPAPAPGPDFGIDAPFESLAVHRNVYWKFTTENFERAGFRPELMQGLVQRAVHVFGADHVLWGSDMGNTIMPYQRMVNAALLATAVLDPVQRRAVLSGTGRYVYGAAQR
ncbi:MAG: amidohydrolase [Betaproteobacteria bacterium]|nr:amidohydrolase [Betaproteobacteria bacterium]